MGGKKKKKQLIKLLQTLYENDKMTISELSKIINLSDKTVRNRLDHLNAYLKKEDLGEIIRKPRIGVWLEVNEDNLATLIEIIYQDTPNILQSDKERICLLIKQFLKYPDNVHTLTELSNKLYLSIPTVSNLVNEAQKWFSNFNIKIAKQPNKGHWLIYDEIDYRVACCKYILEISLRNEIENNLQKFLPGLNIKRIHGIILESESEWEIRLNDDSFVNLLIFSSLMVYRNINNRYAKLSIKNELLDYSEFNFVEMISKKLSNHFSFKYSEDETAILAFQILSNNNYSPDENELLNDKLIEDTVDRMIKTIGEIIDINLQDDEVLKEGLLLHLKPAIFRMKYRYFQRNDQTLDIRNTYPELYRAVWSTSMILEDDFNVHVNESELAYITLYIQASIERNARKLDILFISSKTNAQNQYLIQQLRTKVFGDANITMVSFHQFKKHDIKKYDLIITTDLIDLEDDEKEVINISTVPSQRELRYLNSIANNLLIDKKKSLVREVRCHNLFEPDLIVKKPEVINKKEAIRLLCNLLEEKGYISSKYFNTVLERERKADTALNNFVAIPHGNQEEVLIPKVAMLILDEPVNWTSKDKVHVIYLLAIRMKTEQEMYITTNFYKEYLSSLSEKQSIKDLLSLENSLDIYQYILG